MPLSNLSEPVKPYAKQLEADILSYLESGNKEMSAKCLIAQDILRHVRHKHPPYSRCHHPFCMQSYHHTAIAKFGSKIELQ